MAHYDDLNDTVLCDKCNKEVAKYGKYEDTAHYTNKWDLEQHPGRREYLYKYLCYECLNEVDAPHTPSEKPPRTYRLSVGDWSDDGHGKYDNFYMETTADVSRIKRLLYNPNEKMI